MPCFTFLGLINSWLYVSKLVFFYLWLLKSVIDCLPDLLLLFSYLTEKIGFGGVMLFIFGSVDVLSFAFLVIRFVGVDFANTFLDGMIGDQ